MADLSQLRDFQAASKDGKSMAPIIVNLFETFQAKMTEMFADMKKEFTELVMQDREKFSKLENEVAGLRKKVCLLEEKLEDTEAYERRDTLVFSGKKIPPSQNNENCAQIALRCLAEQTNLQVSLDEVSVAHRLGPKPRDQRPDQRKIIVKFCKRDVKTNILASVRRVKPQDFFINESLTPQRQEIFFGIRKAKREFPNVINGCSTFDGSVYLWVKSSVRDIRLKMNSYEAFEKFCQDKFEKSASYFFQK